MTASARTGTICRARTNGETRGAGAPALAPLYAFPALRFP